MIKSSHSVSHFTSLERIEKWRILLYGVTFTFIFFKKKNSTNGDRHTLIIYKKKKILDLRLYFDNISIRLKNHVKWVRVEKSVATDLRAEKRRRQCNDLNLVHLISTVRQFV